jgi:zinc finger FYVE domain-containing protein 1
MFVSRYVIECLYCGEIYRSRQYWYGNKNPEDAAVRPEIQHVWPGVSYFCWDKESLSQSVLSLSHDAVNIETI